ncbi:hypothetical protein [Alteraurantiacibacter aquimixticola]|nr:hypothetical protein [Alteraurantiacibacter aquimixticola]
MRDRRAWREMSPDGEEERRSRFDRERIILALLGLAGAVAIFAMNTQ